MCEFELDTVKLIEQVQIRPHLWDRTLGAYKERRPTKESWHQICAAIDPSFNFRPEAEQVCIRDKARHRWTNLRDCWLRAHRKETETPPGQPKPRRYVYYKKMLFLRKLFDKGGETSAFVDQSSFFSVKAEPLEFEDLTGEDDGQRETESPRQMSTAGAEPVADQEESISLPEPEQSEAFSWPAFPEVLDTRKTRKRQFNECESTVQTQKVPRTANEDPTLMFFKGLLPLVRNLNNYQMVDFQIGVLQLIKSINEKSQ